jgi:erythritol kinase
VPSRDLIIGIDSGTSLIKAVAFTTAGEQVAMTGAPNVFHRVPGGGAEQDMARTWADMVSAVRRLAEQLPDLADRAAALAITAQGDGTWLIDRDGEPVAPAWLWLDVRAADIADAVIDDPDYPRHYVTTGTGLNACQQGVQLAWLKRHRPEVLARAATALHCKDWLYFRLTGERATDPSEGVFTFGDYRTREYEDSVLERLGIAELKRLLPPIVDGSRTHHPLLPKAAAEIGLAPGTPVVLGYLDVLCSGLGGGLHDRSGKAGCTIIGTTGMHMRLVPTGEVRLNPERSGYTMAFPVPGTVAQMQSNMVATPNIDWLLDLASEVLAEHGVEATRKDQLATLDERVLQAPPAAALYHPFISEAGERGPFLEPTARAQFIGLQAGTGFHALMRAVLEGLAFAARDCYAAMGAAPSEVRIAGGGSRSTAMATILASVLGADVRRVKREETGAAGAAMIAAVQLGIYPDMDACVRTWVDPLLGPPVRPDPALVPLYGRMFEVYRSAREALRPIWRAMDEARREGGSA